MSVVSIEGTLTYVIPPECRSALQAMLPIRRPVKDALGSVSERKLTHYARH